MLGMALIQLNLAFICTFGKRSPANYPTFGLRSFRRIAIHVRFIILPAFRRRGIHGRTADQTAMAVVKADGRVCFPGLPPETW
jgi:hypothetical protein